MEKFVQQYLSTYYYLKTSEVGNDGIYYVNDDRRTPTPHYGSKLIKEIVTVFGLEDIDDNVKIIINDWATTIKPDVDLEFYWKTMEDLFGFPIAQRVVAQTMGMDLVAVQPMYEPRGELFHMDYQCGIDPATGDSQTVITTTRTRTRRVCDEEIFRQNVMQLYENQQNYIVGELDHSSNSDMQRAINKWSSLIGISSRKKED